MYKIYTDGCSKNNGKENNIGGWAYIVLDSNNDILFKNRGTQLNTTNQKMELTAVIKACEYIYNNLYKEDNLFTNFTIYSDSAYLINCYEQNWFAKWENNNWTNSKKEKVKNKELWEKLIPFFKNCHFTFKKVKGHSDDYFNNYVDNMAQNVFEE